MSAAEPSLTGKEKNPGADEMTSEAPVQTWTDSLTEAGSKWSTLDSDPAPNGVKLARRNTHEGPGVPSGHTRLRGTRGRDPHARTGDWRALEEVGIWLS